MITGELSNAKKEVIFVVLMRLKLLSLFLRNSQQGFLEERVSYSKV
jgi:hypothetical protein